MTAPPRQRPDRLDQRLSADLARDRTFLKAYRARRAFITRIMRLAVGNVTNAPWPVYMVIVPAVVGLALELRRRRRRGTLRW